jgi:hypothetical protein
MLFGPVSGADRGALVWNFAVGGATPKRDLDSNTDWNDFVRLLTTRTEVRWEILGFTDCHGEEGLNEALRRQRAQAIYDKLPAGAKAQIGNVDGAPISQCITDNTTEADRTQNRSVFFRQTHTEYTFEDEIVEGEAPDFVCGPDVTQPIRDAVAYTRSLFAGWSPDEKEEACDALDSLRTGEYAWDIVELHNNRWILGYRPTCATVGASPPCGSSVQVGDQCYYAGSANYVIFGTMCRLCFNHFASIPDLSGTYRFRKRGMLHLIDLYKGTGPVGLGTPSSNFAESRQWAEAGYDGWPAGGAPPPGDRNNCVPLCPHAYNGPAFRVNWHPHEFHTGGGGR